MSVATHRNGVRRLLATTLGLCIALVAAEVGLRYFPDAIGQPMANAIYSKYGIFPGGIYYTEPVSRTRVMKRSYSDELYFSGYRWLHETDEYGFRNPQAPAPRSVLLIGDSIIYGHGVEANETVSHFLREAGIGAYNMGQQGVGIYHEYVVFRTFLDRFHPASIVLFTYVNDIHDLQPHLPSSKDDWSLPEISQIDYDAVYASIFSRNSEDNTAADHIRYSPRVSRALEFGFSRILRGDAGKDAVPPYIGAALEDRACAASRRYYEAVLLSMRELCHERGVRFMVIHLSMNQTGFGGRVETAVANFSSAVEHACAAARVEYHDTEELLRGRSECFLEQDGHFTAEGHRVLSEYLLQLLR